MKSQTHRLITATLFAVFLGGGRVHATAVIGATEPTQILNNIQLVASYGTQVQQLAQEVQMVTNQINQYQVMMRNIASLPATTWSQVSSLISSLRNLDAQAQGFAYAASNWDTLFAAQHPNFASYLNGPSLSRTDYTNLYTKWNTSNNEAVVQAVSAAGLNRQNFDTDKSTMDTLESVSDSADGQKQVLQAANKFSLLLNQQLLLLRRLMTEDTQMHATFLAAQSEKEATQAAEVLRATHATINFQTGQEKSY